MSTSLSRAQGHPVTCIERLAVFLLLTSFFPQARGQADDPAQQAALLQLYAATGGPSWSWPDSGPDQQPWNESISYCAWYGVMCCDASGLLQPPTCSNSRSVAVLDLDSLGLTGTLQPLVLSPLVDLTVLVLAGNSALTGRFPGGLDFPHLLYASVQGTGLHACDDAARGVSFATSCVLTVAASFSTATFVSEEGLSSNSSAPACPILILPSFQRYTSQLGLTPAQISRMTRPYAAALVPGGVIADAAFTSYFGCSCPAYAPHLWWDAAGIAQCGTEPVGRTRSKEKDKYIAAIVVVALAPWMLVGLGIWFFIKHKTTLHRLVKSREEELQRKRGKVPGTPGVALHNGRGMLSMSDVMVTWVFTDVADSTQLWEWNTDAMDRAIDLHNSTLRALLDEFGGHEIRNEGDSFALSFHEAVDAVKFCLKAQERLMLVDWPAALLQHPSGSVITVGDLTGNPMAAGLGNTVITGLRVRMGINTGIPDDIFLHDVTEHVDYRGEEYDLAQEICDLAAGGQILMGPKTLQRWNKCFKEGEVAPPNQQADGAWRDTVTNTSFNQGQANALGLNLPRFASNTMAGLGDVRPQLSRMLELPRATSSLNAGNMANGGLEQLSMGISRHPSDDAGQGYPSRVGAHARGLSSSGRDSFMRRPSFTTIADPHLESHHLQQRTLAALHEEFPELMRPHQSPPPSIPSRSPSHMHAAQHQSNAFAQQPITLGRERQPHAQQSPHPSSAGSSGHPPAVASQSPHVKSPGLRPPHRLKQHMAVPPHRLSVGGGGLGSDAKRSDPGGTGRMLQRVRPRRTLSLERLNQDRAERGEHSDPEAERRKTNPRRSPSLLQLSSLANAIRRPGRWSFRRSGVNTTNTSDGVSEGRNSAPLDGGSAGGADSVGGAGGVLGFSHSNAANASTLGGYIASMASGSPPASMKGLLPFGVNVDSPLGGSSCVSPRETMGPGNGTELELSRLQVQTKQSHPGGSYLSKMSVEGGDSRSGSVRAISNSRLFNPLFQPAHPLQLQSLQEATHVYEMPDGLSAHEDRLLRQHASNAGPAPNAWRPWNNGGAELDSPDPGSLSLQPPFSMSESKLLREGGALLVEPLRQLGCGLLLRMLLSKCLTCLHIMTSEEGGWDQHINKSAMEPTMSAYNDSSVKGVVVDMGYYEWRSMDTLAAGASNGGGVAGSHRVYVHLMQIVPSGLAPRVLLFDWPLATGPNWEKISPGFFDAPGSSRLVFPGMRDLLDLNDAASARPVVAVAFSSVEGFKELSAMNIQGARGMLQLHNACVRETLSTCGGYECKEFNGSFMAAFTDSCNALEWALTLQLALMNMAWSMELLSLDLAAEVVDKETQEIVFRGLRCRVGIYSGPIDRVTPHVKTGRADYFGQPVNRAARLMSAAHGGQVVCEQSLAEGVLEEWRQRYGAHTSAGQQRSMGDQDDASMPRPSMSDPGVLDGGDNALQPYSHELRVARSFMGNNSFTGMRHSSSRPAAASDASSDALNLRGSSRQLNKHSESGTASLSGNGSLLPSLMNMRQGSTQQLSRRPTSTAGSAGVISEAQMSLADNGAFGSICARPSATDSTAAHRLVTHHLTDSDSAQSAHASHRVTRSQASDSTTAGGNAQTSPVRSCDAHLLHPHLRGGPRDSSTSVSSPEDGYVQRNPRKFIHTQRPANAVFQPHSNAASLRRASSAQPGDLDLPARIASEPRMCSNFLRPLRIAVPAVMERRVGGGSDGGATTVSAFEQAAARAGASAPSSPPRHTHSRSACQVPDGDLVGIALASWIPEVQGKRTSRRASIGSYSSSVSASRRPSALSVKSSISNCPSPSRLSQTSPRFYTAPRSPRYKLANAHAHSLPNPGSQPEHQHVSPRPGSNLAPQTLGGVNGRDITAKAEEHLSEEEQVQSLDLQPWSAPASGHNSRRHSGISPNPPCGSSRSGAQTLLASLHGLSRTSAGPGQMSRSALGRPPTPTDGMSAPLPTLAQGGSPTSDVQQSQVSYGSTSGGGVSSRGTTDFRNCGGRLSPARPPLQGLLQLASSPPGSQLHQRLHSHPPPGGSSQATLSLSSASANVGSFLVSPPSMHGPGGGSATPPSTSEPLPSTVHMPVGRPPMSPIINSTSPWALHIATDAVPPSSSYTHFSNSTGLSPFTAQSRAGSGAYPFDKLSNFSGSDLVGNASIELGSSAGSYPRQAPVSGLRSNSRGQQLLMERAGGASGVSGVGLHIISGGATRYRSLQASMHSALTHSAGASPCDTPLAASSSVPGGVTQYQPLRTRTASLGALAAAFDAAIARQRRMEAAGGSRNASGGSFATASTNGRNSGFRRSSSTYLPASSGPSVVIPEPFVLGAINGGGVDVNIPASRRGYGRSPRAAANRPHGRSHSGHDIALIAPTSAAASPVGSSLGQGYTALLWSSRPPTAPAVAMSTTAVPSSTSGPLLMSRSPPGIKLTIPARTAAVKVSQSPRYASTGKVLQPYHSSERTVSSALRTDGMQRSMVGALRTSQQASPMHLFERLSPNRDIDRNLLVMLDPQELFRNTDGNALYDPGDSCGHNDFMVDRFSKDDQVMALLDARDSGANYHTMPPLGISASPTRSRGRTRRASVSNVTGAGLDGTSRSNPAVALSQLLSANGAIRSTTGQGDPAAIARLRSQKGVVSADPAETAGGASVGGGGLRTVIAECYKITQQPGQGQDVAQSITMIKYTNLKQELEEMEAEEAEEGVVPTSSALVATVPVDVAVWSLGSFRLKGVTELMKVVQLLPLELEARLNHLPKGTLNKGKARCITRNVERMDMLTIRLPDVSQLQCCNSFVDSVGAMEAEDGLPIMQHAHHSMFMDGEAMHGLMDEVNYAGKYVGPGYGPGELVGDGTSIVPSAAANTYGNGSGTLHTVAQLDGGSMAATAQFGLTSPPPLGPGSYVPLMSSGFSGVATGPAPTVLAASGSGDADAGGGGGGFAAAFPQMQLRYMGDSESEGLAPISEAITPTGGSTTSLHHTKRHSGSNPNSQAGSQGQHSIPLSMLLKPVSVAPSQPPVDEESWSAMDSPFQARSSPVLQLILPDMASRSSLPCRSQDAWSRSLQPSLDADLPRHVHVITSADFDAPTAARSMTVAAHGDYTLLPAGERQENGGGINGGGVAAGGRNVAGTWQQGRGAPHQSTSRLSSAGVTGAGAGSSMMRLDQDLASIGERHGSVGARALPRQQSSSHMMSGRMRQLSCSLSGVRGRTSTQSPAEPTINLTGSNSTNADESHALGDVFNTQSSGSILATYGGMSTVSHFDTPPMRSRENTFIGRVDHYDELATERSVEREGRSNAHSASLQVQHSQQVQLAEMLARRASRGHSARRMHVSPPISMEEGGVRAIVTPSRPPLPQPLPLGRLMLLQQENLAAPFGSDSGSDFSHQGSTQLDSPVQRVNTYGMPGLPPGV